MASVKNTLRNRTGFSLLSLAMLAAVVGLTAVAVLVQISSVRKQEMAVNQQIVAQTFAAELLEFFRAFNSGSSLINYLKKNPAVPANAPYYFCSLINVLDRSTNTILNADPLATLPPSSLDAGTGAFAANRYYLIQVVDANSASIDPSALCNSTYLTAHFDYANDVAPAVLPPANQLIPATFLRALITVGVSWIPKGGHLTDKKEVVLSTLLPIN